VFRLIALGGLLVALVLPVAAAGTFAEKLADLQKQLEAQPTNVALLLKLGDLCHDEGVNDNSRAVVLAEKYLREALKLESNNAPALVLLGSTYTMKGRDAFWPPTKISLVKEGNRIMDRAAALAPDNFQVRLTRGLNNVHMPRFLDREEIARADLAWLWERIGANPDIAPLATTQEVALWFGVALKKAKQANQAKAVWEKGFSLDAKSSFATEIRKHLDKEK
jgi:hypothetical protein